MKFLSDRLTSASGSIGGTTFSHNRAGLYTRARRVPVNPRTPFQTQIRSGLASLQALYPTLNASQQQGWADLASQMTFVDRLGSTFKMTAQQIFVAANARLVQTGAPAYQGRPDSATRCPLNTSPLAVTITTSGTTASLAFDNTEAWANDVNGLLLLYASRPQNSTKNFYAGPYRLAASIAGAMVPPTSPATITLPFASGVVGTKQFFRVVVLLPPTYFPSSSIPLAAQV